MNIVSKVKIENFRVHDSFTIEFKNPTTLIIGENGSGKTSLIEALYISLQGKSFRSHDRDILKQGKDHYGVNTFFADGRKVHVEYSDIINKKQFTIDGKTTTRLPSKYKYPVVLFEPDDLNLIHNSPGKRRDWINHLISVFDAEYHTNLLRYEKALTQRNNALKNDFCHQDDLFAWDVLLAKYGSQIIARRSSVIADIDANLQEIYRSISGNQDEISVGYDTAVVGESEYLRQLGSSFEKDHILRQTTYGPHRDDILFNFDGKLAVNVASRGEIRTIILALKFMEARLIKESMGADPVVLLDDIFSELDNTRQNCLVNNFKNHQVIITSVNPPSGMDEDVIL